MSCCKKIESAGLTHDNPDLFDRSQVATQKLNVMIEKKSFSHVYF